MGLKGLRTTSWINCEFPHTRTSERGGVLTLTTISGVPYAEYSINPSGLSVLGIKLDDHEWIEDLRQSDPTRIRRVKEYFSTTRALVEGDIITDWVHPDYANSIKPGDFAYPGPSGTIINTTDYSTVRVGIFMSTVGAVHYNLNHHDSYTVLLDGGGLVYTWQDPYDHIVKTINAVQIFVPIGGWVKLRVSLAYIGSS